MPRTKLTPEEREAKRKERSRFSFSDAAYKKYDTSQGFGSFESWIKAAEAMMGNRTTLIADAAAVPADLVMFGLDAMPADIKVLKRAYRNSMFVYHPDHGGTEEKAKAANLAFERLCEQYS